MTTYQHTDDHDNLDVSTALRDRRPRTNDTRVRWCTRGHRACALSETCVARDCAEQQEGLG